MASTWTDIPDSTIDRESPLDVDLLVQVRDNLEYLKQQVENIPQTFEGLYVRTHPDADKAAAQVLLMASGAVVMDDGTSYTPTVGLTANTATAGAGGIDTGLVAASRCYELHYIRKEDNTENLILHLAPRAVLEGGGQATSTTTLWIYEVAAQQYFAQDFTADNTGKVLCVDLECLRTGSNSPPSMYVEIQDDAGGLPSGTVIATSFYQYIDTLYTSTGQWVRFMIQNPQDNDDLVAGTKYWVVVKSTKTSAGGSTLHGGIRYHSSGTAEGALYKWDSSGAGWVAAGSGWDLAYQVYMMVDDDPLTLPTDYTKSCHIGYALTDSGSQLYGFVQHNRTIRFRHDLTDFHVANAVLQTSAYHTLLPFLFPYPANKTTSLILRGDATNTTGNYILAIGIKDVFRYSITTVSAENMGGVYQYVEQNLNQNRTLVFMDPVITYSPAIYACCVVGTHIELWVVGFEF
jgi:hypothetical protein